jgi:hypothetical protein
MDDKTQKIVEEIKEELHQAAEVYFNARRAARGFLPYPLHKLNPDDLVAIAGVLRGSAMDEKTEAIVKKIDDELHWHHMFDRM